MARTALLIRCGVEQANEIRSEAQKHHLTISAYVIQVMTVVIQFEEITSTASLHDLLSTFACSETHVSASPRTAILVRCSVEQADLIRSEAGKRKLPINAFVLRSLKRAWLKGAARPNINAFDRSQNQQGVAAVPRQSGPDLLNNIW
jgi:hypothetical protein